MQPGNRELFDANLAALVRHAPRLAERIALPVDGTHVVSDGAGSTSLRRHRALLPLDVGAERIDAARETARERPAVFLLGLGLGEQLAALLAQGGARIVAFERDPWLLRLTLERVDVGPALAEGRLALLLGVDLLAGLADGVARLPRIEHPLLGRLYGEERELLARGLAPRRAGLALGGLLVDDVGAELRERGWSVVPLELEAWSEEELTETVHRAELELLVAINYTTGLADFCRRLGVRLCVWEIDPAVDTPRREAGPTDHVTLATFRKKNVEPWRAAGFSRVRHVPLAANTRRRTPAPADAPVPEVVPVAFVGSSMSRQAQLHRERFLELYTAWHPRRAGARDEGARILAEILVAQRADLSCWLVPELARAYLAPFLDAVADRVRDDPLMLIGEIAGAEKRLTYVANLGVHGIHVWGDEGWRASEKGGATWRGSAGHREELTRIYRGAHVHVDIGRIYQQDIVTMRVFDVLACGGFLIAEHGAELDELFEVGVELESYRTLPELQAKVAHYLAHPDQARAIAARGLAAVRARHTIARRVESLLADTR